MKKMMLSTMLAAFAMVGWAANDGKTLKVTLDLVDFGDSVVVYRSGEPEQIFVGQDGKFEFDLEVNRICNAMLLQPRMLRGDMDEPRIYSIPLVGGEEVRVWDTEKIRYDVDGTGFYADFHQMDLFNEQAEKGVRENTLSIDSYEQTLTDYIKAHSAQEAALWLLRSFDSPDKMKEAYALFDASVREGRMKSLYDSWVKAAEDKFRQGAAEREGQKKQAAGVEAPVFTLNDLEGQPFTLSSLRGKYVILDFWGSWCIWCIKGFPQMKEYYAKYPGKFEILGVDCNDTVEKWKAAVKKYELPWLHVYNPKNSSLLADYGITGFPTKIIVGPDGKIVKTVIGEDPSFYTILDELFSARD